MVSFSIVADLAAGVSAPCFRPGVHSGRVLSGADLGFDSDFLGGHFSFFNRLSTIWVSAVTSSVLFQNAKARGGRFGKNYPLTDSVFNHRQLKFGKYAFDVEVDSRMGTLRLITNVALSFGLWIDDFLRSPDVIRTWLKGDQH